MKSFENKPKEEITAPDGLVSEENVTCDGAPTDATTDHASAFATEPTEASSEPEADEEVDTQTWTEYEETDIPVGSNKDDAEQVTKPIWPPTREQLWTGIAFWGVVILGAILRFWGLGDKPLHHDESLHAYFSLVLMHNNMENWLTCVQTAASSCYRYDPLTHGPFQFHIIAFVYKISQLIGAPDHGVNTTTVRIAAATLGSALVGLPYFLRDYISKIGAWLACFLLAVSPSMVYYSRFAREDIYMAFFTLLTVVALARYVRDRKGGWLLVAALAFTLSYATKEATFLTIAVFGSFLGALIVWELGVRLKLRNINKEERTFWDKVMPTTAAPWFTLGYFAILGIIAKIFFGKLKDLSVFITKDKTNTAIADVYVAHLKANTVALLPWLGMLLAVVVAVLLVREVRGTVTSERRGLARLIERRRQPILDTILTMPWTHWFFSVVCGWFVFIVLFSVLFTNLPGGIGDGIWQGLYYWLQQQQVARGGQPWYYYFLLIPLYEQIGVVFGLAGVVRCLVRPTRFRLFLVYWFIGNVFIYTWAGEKMPWLMIHMTMPMMLLAAIALEPAVVKVIQVVKARLSKPVQSTGTIDAVEERAVPLASEAKSSLAFIPTRARKHLALGSSVATVVLALLLLVPTLQNMFQVTFVHYADAPHEMMIYVQTTTDVDTMMNKIAALDQKLYGGQHKIPIGLVDDATWPFAWYVRDYTNVCFNYPTGCPSTAQNAPVIISSGDKMANMQYQYRDTYQFHQYHMRTQWDQGYMPPPCKVTPTNPCTDPQAYTGVGPWLWLSYGDNPPPGAKFDLGRAVNNIWNWWWQRKAFGSTDGTYDMGLFIRNDVSSQTGIKP
ncbi:flippase activity-associated protein Agl23 [Dictyobacter formicarum]|uniref:Glycosyltransferase RgtA/B/C/D-like domain-containing protein n=1 Tax=Dictyobacter formicarum TaxID=2778368 RepID=A0ABQ3VTF3_9CHLR|nr:flippase activity-associated protein Agl23 [Dictyobacter formicarum]GHO89098.1 hypothetical protein KSZ_71040 [Dictyobacter formicarum]